MKKKSSQPFKKFSPIKLVILFVAGSLLIVLAWNWYVHYQDKQKFMILKQDMLTLQADFNTIESGWTYSEGCHAQGEKYKQNEASSCGISILINASNTDDLLLEKYKRSYSKYFVLDSQSNFVHQNNRYQEMVLIYKKQNIKCSFLTKQPVGLSRENIRSLQCSSSALDFYFPKTQ